MPKSPSVAVGPGLTRALSVVGRSQFDRGRLKRAATVLVPCAVSTCPQRSPGVGATCLLYRVLSLTVTPLVVLPPRFRDGDGVARDRPNRALDPDRLAGGVVGDLDGAAARSVAGWPALRALTVDGGADTHGCRGDRLTTLGSSSGGPHRNTIAGGDVAERGQGDLGDRGRPGEVHSRVTVSWVI